MSLGKFFEGSFWFFLALSFFCWVHFFPLPNFVEMLLCSAGVVILLCWRMMSGVLLWRINVVSLLVVFFLVTCLVTALLGAAMPAEKRQIVLFLIIMVAGIFLASQFDGDETYYARLAWGLLLCGVVQCVGAIAMHYGIFQAVVGDLSMPAAPRMRGFPAQSNLLAILVFLSLLSAVYLYVCGRLGACFLALVLFLFGFVLFAAGSRAALLYFSFSMVLFLGFYRFSKGAFFRVFIMSSLVVLGGGSYLGVDSKARPFFEELGYIQRDSVLESDRDYSTVGFRPSEWRKSWLMLKESPALGVGFGNYGVNSFWMGVKHQWAITEGSFPTHSHNFFTQLGAELGVFALVAGVVGWLALILVWWGAGRSVEWWFVGSVVGVFFVNSMLEYVFWHINYAVLFVFMVLPFFWRGRALVFGFSRGGAFLIGLLALFFFSVISVSWIDVYRRVVLYSYGVDSALQMLDLQVAGEDSVWGSDVKILGLMWSLPNKENIDHYDKVTDELMEWRPVNLVVMRRMHVLALRQDLSELHRLGCAMGRFYPKDIPAVELYLASQEGVRGMPAEAVVRESLTQCGNPLN